MSLFVIKNICDKSSGNISGMVCRGGNTSTYLNAPTCYPSNLNRYPPVAQAIKAHPIRFSGEGVLFGREIVSLR